MTTTDERDVYLDAAEAYIRRNPEIGGMEPIALAPELAAWPSFRNAIDVAVEHGRQVAARAISERAEAIEHDGNRVRATFRRHLWAAARIAAGPMTIAEVTAALNEGKGAVIVCRTRDIEPTS